MLFHRYDAGQGEWQLADVRDLLDYRQRGRRMRTGGTAMTVGGVVFGIAGRVVSSVAVLEGADIRREITNSPYQRAELVARRRRDCGDSASDSGRQACEGPRCGDEAQEVARACAGFICVMPSGRSGWGA